MSIVSTRSERKRPTFSSYNCDLCGIHPIKGFRWECDVCDDFDVCDECHTKKILERPGTVHPKDHTFSRFVAMAPAVESVIASETAISQPSATASPTTSAHSARKKRSYVKHAKIPRTITPKSKSPSITAATPPVAPAVNNGVQKDASSLATIKKIEEPLKIEEKPIESKPVDSKTASALKDYLFAGSSRWISSQSTEMRHTSHKRDKGPNSAPTVLHDVIKELGITLPAAILAQLTNTSALPADAHVGAKTRSDLVLESYEEACDAYISYYETQRLNLMQKEVLKNIPPSESEKAKEKSRPKLIDEPIRRCFLFSAVTYAFSIVAQDSAAGPSLKGINSFKPSFNKYFCDQSREKEIPLTRLELESVLVALTQVISYFEENVFYPVCLHMEKEAPGSAEKLISWRDDLKRFEKLQTTLVSGSLWEMIIERVTFPQNATLQRPRLITASAPEKVKRHKLLRSIFTSHCMSTSIIWNDLIDICPKKSLAQKNAKHLSEATLKSFCYFGFLFNSIAWRIQNYGISFFWDIRAIPKRQNGQLFNLADVFTDYEAMTQPPISPAHDSSPTVIIPGSGSDAKAGDNMSVTTSVLEVSSAKTLKRKRNDGENVDPREYVTMAEFQEMKNKVADLTKKLHNAFTQLETYGQLLSKIADNNQGMNKGTSIVENNLEEEFDEI